MATVTRYVDTSATAGGDGTTQNHSGATRAYASLSEWESAEQTNLVTDGDIHQVHCAGNTTEDTSAVVITGWTTGASNYIEILGDATAPDSDGPHDGYWQTGKYRLHVTSGIGINITEDYVRIRNIQINISGTTGRAVNIGNLTATNHAIHLDSLLLKGGPITGGGVDHSGVRTFDTGGNATNVFVYNCVAWDFYNSSFPTNTSASLSGFTTHFGDMECFNCTAYNCANGFNGKDATYELHAINCLGYCNEVDSNYIDFSGTLGSNNDYNGDTDGTETTGANSVNSQTAAQIKFVSTTETNAGYLALDTGSTMIGVGTDDPSSGKYSDDVRGDSRTSTWDIGADEAAAAGGGSSIKVPQLSMLGVGS